MRERLEWEKVGTCGVDAGCIMLVDPCYVLQDDVKEVTYEEFLQDSAKHNYGIMPFHGGVIVPSGYGDGEYNVYVKKGKTGFGKGRVYEVKIVFVSDEDEDDD